MQSRELMFEDYTNDVVGLDARDVEGKWWLEASAFPGDSAEPKAAVWNPLLSIPVDREIPNTVSAGRISQLVTDAVELVKSFNCTVTPCSPLMEGREAGDDRVDFSPSSTTLAIGLIVQEQVLGMSTSREDTFISTELYNFCEVTSSIPCARQQSLEFAKKRGFGVIGYVDSPPLRLILDVKKNNALEHSSTEVGKCSMLGIRIRDTKPQLLLRMQLAGSLQDGCLRTSSMKEPKPMPVDLGGCGAPSNWGDPRNTYLYMKSFRKGTYDRVYGSAINEARRVVQEADRGLPAVAVISDMLRSRQDYLHATFAEKIAIPSSELIGRREGMPPPLYRAAGVTSGVTGVERRLVRAKLLLPEREARLEWDRESQLSDILMGASPVVISLQRKEQESRSRRERFGGALSGNAAFQNLLRRRADGSEIEKLRQEGFLIATSGRLRMTYEDAIWVHEGCKGEIFTFADLPRSSDMFLREEVSSERTFKIPDLLLHPVTQSGRREVQTVTRLGLWQISQPMEQWAKEKVAKLRVLREDYPDGPPQHAVREVLRENPEWVADDSLITARVFEDVRDEVSTQTVVLVTRDKRLCRQLAQTTNTIVIGLDPVAVAFAYPYKIYSAGMEITPSEVVSILEEGYFHSKGIRVPSHVYIDTGSMAAALLDKGLSNRPDKIYRETLHEAAHVAGQRVCTLARQSLASEGVRSQVILAWPTTVTSENPLFTGEPEVRKPGGSTTSSTFSRKMRAYMH